VGRPGGDNRAKLPDRPLRRGMLSHVPVEDPTPADFEEDTDIEDAKADGDGLKKPHATTACP
jgi:hypothetical protein